MACKACGKVHFSQEHLVGTSTATLDAYGRQLCCCAAQSIFAARTTASLASRSYWPARLCHQKMSVGRVSDRVESVLCV